MEHDRSMHELHWPSTDASPAPTAPHGEAGRSGYAESRGTSVLAALWMGFAVVVGVAFLGQLVAQAYTFLGQLRDLTLANTNAQPGLFALVLYTVFSFAVAVTAMLGNRGAAMATLVNVGTRFLVPTLGSGRIVVTYISDRDTALHALWTLALLVAFGIFTWRAWERPDAREVRITALEDEAAHLRGQVTTLTRHLDALPASPHEQ